MGEQNTIAQEKTTNYKMILTPFPPHHNINQPPPTYPIPIPIPIPPHTYPMICNNNTMGMAFLVQMRQSNKLGSVRNDEIFNLHLGP